MYARLKTAAAQIKIIWCAGPYTYPSIVILMINGRFDGKASAQFYYLPKI